MKALSLAVALPFTALLATASHAVAQAADPRQAIAEFAQYMASEHGFDRRAVESLIPREPNARILASIEPSATAEKRSWRRYYDNFVNAGRIARGLSFWEQNAAALGLAEARFGVPAEIIVAIIGVETNYGRQSGGYRALEALSTLAFHYPPRSDYFRRELAAFLLYTRENALHPERVKGSYAGATGIPQFMPSSIRNYAIDFDGDRRIDLAGSTADAIGSVAAFLQFHGWIPDGRIAYPVDVATDLPDQTAPEHWLGAGVRPTLAGPLSLWSRLSDRAPEDVALISLRSDDEVEYWWGFHNLYVISLYNRSTSYAMAVHLLAESVAAARRERTARADSPATRRPGG